MKGRTRWFAPTITDERANTLVRPTILEDHYYVA